MEKRKLIELIQHKCQPLDETGKFPYRVIEGWCEVFYKQLLLDHKRRGLIDLEHYSRIYQDVAVQNDSYSDLQYSDLPTGVKLITTPEGVVSISTDKGTTTDFYPVTERMWRQSNSLESGNLNTDIGFWVRDGRVWYNTNMTNAISNDAVRMVLCLSFLSFDEDDEISIPVNPADFITNVVNLAVTGTQPVDLVNNNADTP